MSKEERGGECSHFGSGESKERGREKAGKKAGGKVRKSEQGFVSLFLYFFPFLQLSPFFSFFFISYFFSFFRFPAKH